MTEWVYVLDCGVNYSIIYDSFLLEDFIQKLPDLKENETFYCCLFSRKKYFRLLKSDKSQLKRFTSNKERLIDKIRQLECEVGSYKQDGIGIPQEALALYISPNPRNNYKATIKGIQRFAQLIENQNQNFNPHQEILSVIQQTAGTKKWVIFDIDTKEISKPEIESILGTSEFLFLETRGGFHVLVEPNKVPKSHSKTWHQNLSKISDVRGDCLIPVPGCCQGGFIPRFV